MLNLLQSEKAAAESTLAAAKAWLDKDAATAAITGGVVMVPLRKILDNPYQPRSHYDAEHILSLAASIKAMKSELASTRGLQQIPMARVGMMQRDGSVVLAAKNMYANGSASRVPAKADGVVQLMFGHSRLRAFMVLSEGIKSLGKGHAIGLDFTTVGEIETRFAELLDADLDYVEMPLMLGFALDHAMWAHAITENSQRKNITAIEEATSIQRAIDEFGLTTEEAGKPFGYARSTTANKVRLLGLPADVRAAIADGRLTERHGRELLRLADDPERLADAAAAALTKGLTVRQIASDVDWRERDMRERQAKQAEKEAARSALAAGWSLPGQSVPVPLEKLDISGLWTPSPFDATDRTDAALIAQGACGPHCECFVIKYSNYQHENGYHPDAEKAPHVVACCANFTERRSRVAELALPADATPEEVAKKQAADERAAQVRALNNEAHRIWQAWLKEQDLQTLWNDIRFWRTVAKHHSWLLNVLDTCEGVHDGCQELLRLMYKRTRGYDTEFQNEVHRPDDVRALIKSLGGKA
jgi:ParB-like chromosome segregation protein Spo0J